MMKTRMILSVLAMAGFFFGASFASDCRAESANITKTKMEKTEGEFKVSAAEYTLEDGESKMESNHFYYWHYHYYGYYTYYYVPCYYTYHCVWYYNGLDDKDGAQGLKIEETPKAGTALNKLGVKKGDIILKIDGKAVESADDIEKITENSKLSIAKTNSEPTRFGGADSVDDFLNN